MLRPRPPPVVSAQSKQRVIGPCLKYADVTLCATCGVLLWMLALLAAELLTALAAVAALAALAA